MSVGFFTPGFGALHLCKTVLCVSPFLSVPSGVFLPLPPPPLCGSLITVEFQELTSK